MRKEVAYKKLLAEEAGLDKLLLDAYHRSIRYYPVWHKSDETKKYIYPGVEDISDKFIKEPAGDTYVTEFSLGGKKYKLVSLRRGTFLARGIYYVVELFLNGEKAFAVSEKHDLRIRDRHYYTLNIEAYRSEDWVEDFRKINEFYDAIEKTMREAPAEDPEFINRLKNNFNVDGVSMPVELLRRKKPRLELLIFIVILILTLIVSILKLSR